MRYTGEDITMTARAEHEAVVRLIEWLKRRGFFVVFFGLVLAVLVYALWNKLF